MDELYIDKFPLPALQEVLLKLRRLELNKVCNLSKQAKKICVNKNFQEKYNLLHPIYTDRKVIDNIPRWIKNTVHETNPITPETVIDFLLFIEEKTKDNKDKIIFYGEEIFTSEFTEKTSRLEAGFIAKSLFVGIIGSIIVEDILEPGKLENHLGNYREFIEGNSPFLYMFLLFLYEFYESYSTIFDLNDTFTSKIYTRIIDENGLRYQNTDITATLKDVKDIWNMKRVVDSV